MLRAMARKAGSEDSATAWSLIWNAPTGLVIFLEVVLFNGP
jgi:hypothetical protein